MLAIFEKIRRPAVDAADLQQRHAEVAETIPQLEAEVRRQQQRRADGLLSLSDREVEKIEAELALALRNRDRARAALDELERRAADAVEAEKRAVLDGKRAVVEEQAAKIAAKLRREYEAHGSALCRLLAELEEAERATRDLNYELRLEGRADFVPAVEERVLGSGMALNDVATIRAMTALRPVGKCPGWGMSRVRAETMGLPR